MKQNDIAIHQKTITSHTNIHGVRVTHFRLITLCSINAENNEFTRNIQTPIYRAITIQYHYAEEE